MVRLLCGNGRLLFPVPTAHLIPYIGKESGCLKCWFRYGLLKGTLADGSGCWGQSGSEEGC